MISSHRYNNNLYIDETGAVFDGWTDTYKIYVVADNSTVTVKRFFHLCLGPAAGLERGGNQLVEVALTHPVDAPPPAVSSTAFADDGNVAGWAKSEVAFMSGKEISRTKRQFSQSASVKGCSSSTSGQ